MAGFIIVNWNSIIINNTAYVFKLLILCHFGDLSYIVQEELSVLLVVPIIPVSMKFLIILKYEFKMYNKYCKGISYYHPLTTRLLKVVTLTLHLTLYYECLNSSAFHLAIN